MITLRTIVPLYIDYIYYYNVKNFTLLDSISASQP
jgi:hypothetical protein